MGEPRSHARGTQGLAARIRADGGVVPVRALQRAGFSRHQIDRAVAQGVLRRVRKGWVARPDADPELVAAARAGVVLSCISLARRRGLWVLDHDRLHVAAPAHAGGVHAPGATVHWAKPVVPRHPDALIDSIENALVLVAECQPYESALAVWESALNAQLVDRLQVARMPLPRAAREIIAAASPYSDSGLESFVVPRLSWLGVPIVPQVWIAGHRVDFLIGDRLVLQIDGGHHVGSQRTSDISHDARLILMGYHVVRVGYRQMVDDWHTVQDLVMRAVAQGLHREQPRTTRRF